MASPIAEDSFQPIWSSGLTRAHGTLHSPSNIPAYSSIWTKHPAQGFLPLQRKTAHSIWPGNSMHSLAWLSSPNNKPHRLMAPSAIPPGQGSLFILLPTTECSTQSQPSSKPAREPMQLQNPSYSLAWTGNQVSSQSENRLSSANSTTPNLIAWAVASPQNRP